MNNIQKSCIFIPSIYVLLATGLGSIPSVATIMGFLLESIVSNLVYDMFQYTIMKGSDAMKVIITVLGLGGCGDMV